MTLVAAAVLPHPPLLVPEVAAGAAPELDDLRAACAGALAALAAASPDRLVAVGDVRPGEPLARSFRPYGVDVPVTTEVDLPLSLLVAAWLLDRYGRPAPVTWQPVEATATPTACAAAGHDLAVRPGRTALLVMGDASARREPAAPRPPTPAAAAYDRRLADALAAADAGRLLGLDPAEAAELAVAGRAAWQVLAGAAGEARFSGRVTYDAAPYGVGYLVAEWRAQR